MQNNLRSSHYERKMVDELSYPWFMVGECKFFLGSCSQPVGSKVEGAANKEPIAAKVMLLALCQGVERSRIFSLYLVQNTCRKSGHKLGLRFG